MDMSTAAGHGAAAIPGGGFSNLLRRSLAAHGIYWAIVAIYYAGFLVFAVAMPEIHIGSFATTVAGFLIFSLPFMLLCLLIMRFYHLARHVKPKSPAIALFKDVKAFLSHRTRLAHGLPMILILLLFMYVFVSAKANVPVAGNFAWDPAMAAADKALFFGHHPWEVLQPVLGYWPVTLFINVAYNIWFVVMWIVWVQLAFAEDTSELRTRFFVTFFLTWIIGGSILAIAFSSAGPCYYGRLGYSPDPYAELMSYLRGVNEIVPVWAVSLQDILWNSYAGHKPTVGISAMPSMHNGTALLFALAAYRISRPWGIVLGVHTALIFIGSIHLGWHYAIDGLAGFALTLAIWHGALPLVRWWQGSAAQRSFAQTLSQIGPGTNAQRI
jgi:hypothetical protein